MKDTFDPLQHWTDRRGIQHDLSPMARGLRVPTTDEHIASLRGAGYVEPMLADGPDRFSEALTLLCAPLADGGCGAVIESVTEHAEPKPVRKPRK